MCGLWGAIGQALDIDLVREAALAAAVRGPDAYGFAWQEPEMQRPSTIWKRGRLDAHAPLEEIHGTWTIGNCRLATSGNRDNAAGIQPLTAMCDQQPLVFSHNGNIYNAPLIFEQFAWQRQTDCDSEAFVAAFCSSSEPDPIDRLRHTLDLLAMTGTTPFAALLRYGDFVFALRYRHPLFVLTVDGTNYFSSRPFRPQAAKLPERTISMFDAYGLEEQTSV